MSDPATRQPMGRPTIFSPEVGTELCLWLCEGGSLRRWCAIDGNPSKSSICAWLTDPDPDTPKADFLDQYARAREFQGDDLADLALDIAMGYEIGNGESLADCISESTDEAGLVDAKLINVLLRGNLERDRFKVDTCKWKAGVLAPKKHARRIIVDQQRGGGEAEALAMELPEEDQAALLSIVHQALQRGNQPASTPEKAPRPRRAAPAARKKKAPARKAPGAKTKPTAQHTKKGTSRKSPVKKSATKKKARARRPKGAGRY